MSAIGRNTLSGSTAWRKRKNTIGFARLAFSNRNADRTRLSNKHDSERSRDAPSFVMMTGSVEAKLKNATHGDGERDGIFKEADVEAPFV